MTEPINLKPVNRLEVIDHTTTNIDFGRPLTKWDDKPFAVELDYQDEGKTLKIFLSDATDVTQAVAESNEKPTSSKLDEILDKLYSWGYECGTCQVSSMSPTYDKDMLDTDSASKEISTLLVEARIEELENMWRKMPIESLNYIKQDQIDKAFMTRLKALTKGKS